MICLFDQVVCLFTINIVLSMKFSEAKAMAEKAQADAMAMVQSKCVLQ